MADQGTDEARADRMSPSGEERAGAGGGAARDRAASWRTEPLIFVVPSERAAFETALDRSSVILHAVTIASDGALGLEGQPGGEIDALPVGLVGLAAASDEAEATLGLVADRLAEAFGRSVDGPTRFATPIESAEVLRWALGRSTDMLTRVAQRNVALMRELGAVRQVHDEMQGAFAGLEAFVEAAGIGERIQALILDKQGKTVMLGGRHSAWVAQRLPVPSPGVSDIAIHLPTVPGDRDGVLSITLSGLETGRVLGTWSVRGETLRPGWIRLALSRCLEVDPESLVIAVAWEGAAPAELSLAARHPEPRWCAKDETGALGNALAVKVWQGMPGVRMSPSSGSVPPIGTAPRRWRLGAEAFALAEAQGAAPGSVGHLEQRAALRVSPGQGKPTLARLAGACPGGARHIRARVFTDDADAPVIEYALAVRPTPGAERLETALPAQGVSSPWVKVLPLSPSQVHLSLPAPLLRRGDLYLGTRFAPGSGDGAAVPALFWDVELTTEPGAAQPW